MILDGPTRQLRSRDQNDGMRERKSEREREREREREDAFCSRILMSTKGNINFFPIFFLFPFFSTPSLSGALWCIALNHCHTKAVFPIMPLVWLITVSSCGIGASPAHLLCCPNWTDDLPICHVYLQLFLASVPLLCSAPSEHSADVSSVFLWQIS